MVEGTAQRKIRCYFICQMKLQLAKKFAIESAGKTFRRGECREFVPTWKEISDMRNSWKTSQTTMPHYRNVGH